MPEKEGGGGLQQPYDSETGKYVRKYYHVVVSNTDVERAYKTGSYKSYNESEYNDYLKTPDAEAWKDTNTERGITQDEYDRIKELTLSQLSRYAPRQYNMLKHNISLEFGNEDRWAVQRLVQDIITEHQGQLADEFLSKIRRLDNEQPKQSLLNTNLSNYNYSMKQPRLDPSNPKLKNIEYTKYTYNCQRCVQAYLLRRLGYAVIAKPNDTIHDNKGDDYIVDAGSKAIGRYGYEIAMFATDSVKMITPKRRSGPKQKIEIERAIKKAGNGAIFFIGVNWQGDGAHVFIGQNVDGEVQFCDPQSGNTDCSYYFESRMIHAKDTEYYRVDKLPLNGAVMGDIVEEDLTEDDYDKEVWKTI